MARRAVLIGVLACLASAVPPAARASCSDPLSRADYVFEEADWGEVAATATYAVDDAETGGRGVLRAQIGLRLEAAGLESLRRRTAASLCVAVVVDREGDRATVLHQVVEAGDLSAARAWTFHAGVELAEDAEQVLVLVEESGSGRWGGAIADAAEAPATPQPGAVRLGNGAWFELEGVPVAPTAREEAAAKTAASVIRLVPPRGQPATGGTRFDALVTSDTVEKVVFWLDGRQVSERKRKPFVARIDLASPAKVQTVRAVAYDAEDREMGADAVVVNQLDVPFRVRITQVAGDPAAGQVRLAADVSVPPGARLDRIEVYRNDTLVERLDKGPVQVTVPTPTAGPEDFLRVAAFLADGSSIDDVVLLAFPEVEEVDVNLVEIHVIVTDAGGHPVPDLRREDFTVVHDGKERAVEGFHYADDVSLLLGVVIDTSGSMELLMQDTRQAAAKFLGRTVLPQDRAFVVDFADKPRLLQPTTGEMTALLLSLGRLRADGRTAMYDAIVFSMLQFEKQPGRKALVVLTDGDDLDSRYGPKHCVEYSEKAGVPVYVIGLGALDGMRRSYSKADLRKLTDETGGRLYMVDTFDELGAAYDQINAELRSQYTLSFYTDRDLTNEERREVQVRLSRPGLTARTLIGTGPEP